MSRNIYCSALIFVVAVSLSISSVAASSPSQNPHSPSFIGCVCACPVVAHSLAAVQPSCGGGGGGSPPPPPPPCNGFSGSGSTTESFLGYTWYWYSSTTVNTCTHQVTFVVQYPNAWVTGTLGGVTFAGGTIYRQDAYGTSSFPWTVGMDFPIATGYYEYTTTLPYSTTNTGVVMTVYCYYAGVNILGDPEVAAVQMQYTFYVGS